MAFILGFILGAVVASVAFIVFHKNNMNKINKARAEILTVYRNSPLDEVANRFDESLSKYFKKGK